MESRFWHGYRDIRSFIQKPDDASTSFTHPWASLRSIGSVRSRLRLSAGLRGQRQRTYGGFLRSRALYICLRNQSEIRGQDGIDQLQFKCQ